MNDEAKLMGAVNTLHYEHEKWVGYNTDGYGLSRGISNDLSFDVNESNVLLLGAGGATCVLQLFNACLMVVTDYLWSTDP